MSIAEFKMPGLRDSLLGEGREGFMHHISKGSFQYHDKI
jgi:hypothetical protein